MIDTTTQSADTPESVAAKLRRTPLYEGSGEESDLPDEAADLLDAQAAEIARLTSLEDEGADPRIAFLLRHANDALRKAEAAEARATAAEAQAGAMREALEREAAWNEAEAATCDRQAAEFKRDRTAGSREMHYRCDAAADAHRKAVRRLRASLTSPATADGLARELAQKAEAFDTLTTKAREFPFSRRQAFFPALQRIVSEAAGIQGGLAAWPDAICLVKPEHIAKASATVAAMSHDEMRAAGLLTEGEDHDR